MSVLAVDPGKRAGWCFLGNGWVKSGVIDGARLPLVVSVLEEYRAHAPVVVVEQQYIQFRRGLITLVERRCLWSVMAEYFGLEVVLVEPTKWQAYFKVKRGNKQQVRRVAESLVGRPCQPDEADAVCIAHWYAGR